MPPEFLQMLLLGVLSGASICSLSCLPFLAPYLMGTGSGFKDGIRGSALFLAGKIVTYATLGALAALGGNAVLSGQSEMSGMLSGMLLIAVALSIPFSRGGACPNKACRADKKIALFGLGISSSVRPCPTMAAVALLAAKNGSVLAGLGYGSFFGLGLAISPLLLIGGGLSLIGDRLRTEAGRMLHAIRTLSVCIMIGMGLRLMLYPGTP